MLTRIEKIASVGLLHDARGVSFTLGQRALIYADNGRGKSTIASILQSCASGSTRELGERQTVDSTTRASVIMQFDGGHRVNYSDGQWSEIRPELLVYNSEFVERNVYSGTEVTPENRKNLLDFALGRGAVVARTAELEATAAQQAASEKIRRLSSELSAKSPGVPLSVFRSLRVPEDVDRQMEVLRRRILAANQADTIRKLPIPEPIPLPELDLDEVFRILNLSLDDVHAEADRVVNEHVHSVGNTAVAAWISQGQEFDTSDACPYCGQSITGLELIEMYKSHFNTAYQGLKKQIEATAQDVMSVTSAGTYDKLVQSHIRAEAEIGSWATHLDIASLELRGYQLIEDSLMGLRELLGGLFARKILAPTDPLGMSGDQTEAKRLWAQTLQVVADDNAIIAAQSRAVEIFLTSIASSELADLQSEFDRLQLARVRHDPVVAAVFADLADAEVGLQTAEAKKKDARVALNLQMEATLLAYRTDVNHHLIRLGAAFEIDEFRTNYLGAAPRTDYGITLRGVAVRLGGGIPSFATALSEGDKRTMALAFFAASTLADPDLQSRIVVVDDPVSSLDRSRRDYTAQLLVEIAGRCRQMIVLAHDATFLRDLDRLLTRQDSSKSITALKLHRISGDYTDFGKVDLDRECESAYYRNYRIVDEFIAGVTDDHLEAGVAMRPLVEGYLHRRYPGKIRDGVMLGKAIEEIGDARKPSPLVHAQTVLGELRQINEFASKFHHDNTPDTASPLPDSAAVATYSRRALSLIHGGS